MGGRKLPIVVFVTAHDSYPLKAFEIHALDYVLKPGGLAKPQKDAATVTAF
jgi:two-component system, LytTR family, response regulator